MSAADRLLNKKPVIGHVLTLLIMLIVTFTAYALNTNDINSREFKGRIDSNTLTLESKVDKTYVDNAIKDHEAAEIKNYEVLKDLMEAYLNGQKELIQSIDKRLERIENKN